jgi:hypothetical protein
MKTKSDNPKKARAGTGCMCGYVDTLAIADPHDKFTFFVAPIKLAHP